MPPTFSLSLLNRRIAACPCDVVLAQGVIHGKSYKLVRVSYDRKVKLKQTMLAEGCRLAAVKLVDESYG